MHAPDVLARLSALGVRVTRDGNCICAAPRSALTDEARALIRVHKAELLAALDGRSPLSYAEREKLLALAARWQMDADDIAVMLRQCEFGFETMDGRTFTAAEAKGLWLADANGLH
jgi:TubC N-terminal docking domain